MSDKSKEPKQTKKKVRKARKVKVPILNDENFNDWQRRIVENFKAYRINQYVERDIRYKEVKNPYKEEYNRACKIVYNLLLGTTEKDDKALIKEKTNENITTAYNALIQKYENTKTERTIKIFEKFLSSKHKPTTEPLSTYLKQQISKMRIAIKNIDSIDDFAFLLLISRLNNEFPNKFKSVEDYIKENIERITIDDLEKKIIDLERPVEKRNVSGSSRSTGSMSSESVDFSLSGKEFLPVPIKSEIKEAKQLAMNPKSDVRIPKVSSKLDSTDQTSSPPLATPFSSRSLNNTKSLELINLIKPKIPKSVDPNVAAQPIKKEGSLQLETFETSTFATTDLSKSNDQSKNHLLEKSLKTSKIDSAYDSKSLRLSSMESEHSYKPGDFGMDKNQPKSSKSLFKTISNYFQSPKKQLFDTKNPNLNLDIKESEYAKLNLGTTTSPSTSISQSLSSNTSQSSLNEIKNDLVNQKIDLKVDQSEKQNDARKDDQNVDHKDGQPSDQKDVKDLKMSSEQSVNNDVNKSDCDYKTLNFENLANLLARTSKSNRVELNKDLIDTKVRTEVDDKPKEQDSKGSIITPQTSQPFSQSPVDQQPQSNESSVSSQSLQQPTQASQQNSLSSYQLPQTTQMPQAPAQNLQSTYQTSQVPQIPLIAQTPQTPQMTQVSQSTQAPQIELTTQYLFSISRHLFKFDQLPATILKKIFFKLSKKDLIKFMKVDPEFSDAVNEFLKETVVVTQNYYVNEPFFQNLFYTNEYVDHRTIIRTKALNVFKEKGHLDIDKQIRKLITNELLKSIEQFKNLEHLEILIESKVKSVENEFELNLKNLKTLAIDILPECASDLNIKISSLSLNTLKLVNFVNIKVSNPEHIEYLHLDAYDKLANKFHNLMHFSCRDFTNFKNGLLNKKSETKTVRLANATSKNLNNLFNLKKKFKLKCKIYVQGIKVENPNHLNIIRDVTTFFGEMRIYLKYIKRLSDLDFLTSLNVNFDLVCLDHKILVKLINLMSIEINYQVNDQIKWSNLLRQSRILQKITINWPIAQAYLDTIPYFAPNCKELNVCFTTEFNFLFLSKLIFLKSIQIIHPLNPINIYTILQYRHRYLSRIQFNYRESAFKIDLFLATNQVRLDYNNKSIIFFLNDFETQLGLASDWTSFVNRM